MLTKLKENYKKLLTSKEFKKEGFLSGAFLMCEINDIEKTAWQIDFYNKDSDTVTTYLLNEEIEVTDSSKILKDENTEIEELNLEEIKIDFKDIENTLNDSLKKYNEIPLKITIILQKQKTPVWNIIYITKKFNILNIKIDASDGKLIEDKIVQLVSFDKGGKEFTSAKH